MDFIENIRVGEERAQAGVGAEQDRPASIHSVREIVRIGVAKDPSAQGDELAWLLFTKHRIGEFGHLVGAGVTKIILLQQ